MNEFGNYNSSLFTPGQVCILDKMNEMRMAGTTLTFVKIVKELPRWLLKRSYEVQFCTSKGEPLSDSSFPVDEFRLTPYFDQEYIIRFPNNVPMVAPIEVSAFKYIYDIAKQSSNIPDDVRGFCDDLLLKLQFFVTVEREY